jgi:cytochrome c-type biogenesis protein CcmH/NrfF
VNIKNIQPTDCPDELTAEDREFLKLCAMLRSCSPEALQVMIDMIEDAEQMFSEGQSQDDVIRYLERNYGA